MALHQKNPLVTELETSLPGSVVSLPSGGIFYEKGVVSCDPSNVPVRPLSAWSEMHWRDPNRLSSNKSTELMISETCPAIAEPAALLAIDVEAILISARIASYGRTTEIEVECSNEECKAKQTVVVDLVDRLAMYRPIGPVDRWKIEFPSGQKATIRPPTYAFVVRCFERAVLRQRQQDALKLAEDTVDREQLQKIRTEIATDMVDMTFDLRADMVLDVTSRDGKIYSDRKDIAEWIRMLPAPWLTTIDDTAEKGMSDNSEVTKIAFECATCHKVTKDVPFMLDYQRFFGSGSAARAAPTA